jgi:hypothetical protein
MIAIVWPADRIRKIMHLFKGERGHRTTGADLLLQVRCAVYNGALGSGFGHLVEPVSSPGPQLARAA